MKWTVCSVELDIITQYKHSTGPAGAVLAGPTLREKYACPNSRALWQPTIKTAIHVQVTFSYP